MYFIFALMDLLSFSPITGSENANGQFRWGQTRTRRSLYLIPGDHVFRKRIVIGHTAIQLSALFVGKREGLGIGSYGCPNLLDKRKPFIDVESIYSQGFDRNAHGYLRPKSQFGAGTRSA